MDLSKITNLAERAVDRGLARLQQHPKTATIILVVAVLVIILAAW